MPKGNVNQSRRPQDVGVVPATLLALGITTLNALDSALTDRNKRIETVKLQKGLRQLTENNHEETERFRKAQQTLNDFAKRLEGE